MARRLWVFLAAVLISSSTLFAVVPPGITLIGKGFIGGGLLDKSGLSGNICQAGNPANCVAKSIFGGFGSDMAYTGHDNVFIAAPDRGPFDGLTDVPSIDRVHFLHITTTLGAAFPNIRTVLLDTRLLKNEIGDKFLGAAGAFDVNDPLASLRLDPEGIQASYTGTFYVSDEYGPSIFEFDRQGHIIRRLTVPETFLIVNPSALPNDELLNNNSGRQGNRGMEGLAISPDGWTLFGMMQNALLQDHALAPGTVDRVSVYTRILKVDVATGETHEYVYQLDNFNRGQGVSEILAINDHEFLVVERDNRSWLAAEPQAPTRKNIYKINLAGATDVTNITLPAAGALPAGVVRVAKSLFIDLLEPAFGLQNADTNVPGDPNDYPACLARTPACPAIAEKIEGLAWGPDLQDGRHVLYVVSDNDLNPAVATQIYAFAIDDAAASLDFQRQALPGPLYPPGQVKKAIGR